jgi:hypothetical protein
LIKSALFSILINVKTARRAKFSLVLLKICAPIVAAEFVSIQHSNGLCMRNNRWLCLFGGAMLIVLLGWNWRSTELPAADKPVKVHVLYTSDAVGYHEPCG